MPAALLNDGDDYHDDVSIVGMWHVVFTGQTMNGGSYTLPEPFDNSVVVWHSDGTEIMNSSRPAQDGNFCMGVWQQTGRRQYFLNHIPWQGNDPMGNPQDGAQILEQVTLSPDGSSLFGKVHLSSVRHQRKPHTGGYGRSDGNTHHPKYAIQQLALSSAVQDGQGGGSCSFAARSLSLLGQRGDRRRASTNDPFAGSGGRNSKLVLMDAPGAVLLSALLP